MNASETSPTSPNAKAGGKRHRVPLSCLECRRLKLKCDRAVPCSSCVRRGVAALCPDGQLQPGRGTKYVLATTEPLQQKIEQLIERIHFLEDALAASKGDSTDWQREKPHPHLDAMLSTHRPDSKSQVVDDDPVEALQEALGTLIIGEGGHARWLGPTAFSESYLQPDIDQGSLTGQEGLPSFPLTFRPPLEGMTKESLLGYLPPFEEASSLFEAYVGHIGWLCQPFGRTTFLRDTMKPTYNGDPALVSPDKLSLLFMVFAVGTIVDLTRPIYDPSARTYYLLALTALSLEDIFMHPSIYTLQALHVICTYLQISEDPRDPAVAPIFSSIAIKLAQSIGLHRDAARFTTMNDEDIRDRRRLWWELVSGDAFLSLSLGRPATASYQHSDCLFPEDTQDNLGAHPLFQRGKFSLMKECMLPLLDQAMSTTPPSYAKILQMDTTIREWDYPAGRHLAAYMEREPSDSGHSLARVLMTAVPEVALLYLHRTSCSRALRENPEDPLKSRYAPSLVAAYQSAVNVLRGCRHMHEEQPGLVVRLWVFAIHSISAAVVLGAIVSQAPGLKLAETALSELEHACQFFEKAQANARINRALPTIMKLRQKAHYAFAQFKAGLWIPPVRGANSADQDDADAPGIITGTKVMAAKGTESSTTSGTPSWRGSQSPQSIHPTLEGYLHSVLQPGPLDNQNLLSASQLDSNALFQVPDSSMYPPMPWANPQLPLDTSAPLHSTFASPNFVDGLAAGFVPVHDASKAQSLNEEWARFMNTI